jgi:integrase
MKGHIRERSPGHWAIVLDVRDQETGKRRRKWHSFEGTKREAQREAARLIAEIASGGYVEPSKQTFGHYFEKWLRDWAPLEVGPKTLETYGHWGRHLTTVIGAMPIQKVRGGDLNRTYREAAAKGLSPNTVKDIHILALRVFGHALRQGDIKRNPCQQINAPEAKRKEAAFLRPEEIPVMLEALRGTALLYTIAVVALGTGARRGELCALRWNNVRLNAGELDIKQSLEQTRKGGLRFKEPKTDRGWRTISLPSSVIACLQEHRLRQLQERLKLGLGKPPADTLVFGAPDGQALAPDYVGNSFGRAMVSAGLPHVTLKSLRHTHASTLIKSGEDILTISRRMGHASPTITLTVYGHLISSRDGAAAAIEAMLRGETKW